MHNEEQEGSSVCTGSGNLGLLWLAVIVSLILVFSSQPHAASKILWSVSLRGSCTSQKAPTYIMTASSEQPPLPPFPTPTSSLAVPINWTVTATFYLEIIPSQCICLQTVCLDPVGIRGNACVTHFLPIGCRVLSAQLPVNIFFRRQTYWWVDLHIVKWTLVLGGLNGAWLQYVWHWGICKHISCLQFLVLRNDSGQKLNLSLCDVCKAKCISFALWASNGTRLFTLTCQTGAHRE